MITIVKLSPATLACVRADSVTILQLYMTGNMEEVV